MEDFEETGSMTERRNACAQRPSVLLQPAPDDFLLYLQPLVEMKIGRLLGAEALVRLKDSDGTVVFPDEFIPAAGFNGLVTVLGLQVFRKVCSFISQGDMQQSGIEWININVSPV